MSSGSTSEQNKRTLRSQSKARSSKTHSEGSDSDTQPQSRSRSVPVSKRRQRKNAEPTESSASVASQESLGWDDYYQDPDFFTSTDPLTGFASPKLYSIGGVIVTSTPPGDGQEQEFELFSTPGKETAPVFSPILQQEQLNFDNSDKSGSSQNTILQNNSDTDMPTAEEERARHVDAVLQAAIEVEDDYSTIVHDECTHNFIQDYCLRADKLKSAVQQAQVFLQNNEPNYKKEYEEKIISTKKSLLEFIRKSQKFLSKDKNATGESTPRDESAQVRAMMKIKKDRVDRHKASTVEELINLTEEFDKLASTTPATDMECREQEEQLKSINAVFDLCFGEARLLTQDATETGHESAAVELEDSVRALQRSKSSANTHMRNQKAKLGLMGQAGFARLTELKLPYFSGDSNDKLDFYTFKEEFEDYLKTKVMSKADQLKLLQKTCLTGSAKNACVNMESIEDIWDYLRETFGSVKILFSNKIEELRKLGRCTGSYTKQREWAVSVKMKLDHLLALSKKHNLLNQLYYCPALQEIQSALPAEIHEEFKKELKKIQKDSGTSLELTGEVVVPALINYMGEVIEHLTFEINYELSNGTQRLAVNNAPSFKPGQKSNGPAPGKKAFPSKQKQAKTTSNVAPSTQPAFSNSRTPPKWLECVICNKKHCYMFYCEAFQKAKVKERYALLKNAKVCFRCLRMDSNPDLTKREAWWHDHESNCNGE